MSQAFQEGRAAGHADRLLGRCNSYSWFVESHPGYARDYSLGYRAGFISK